MGQLLSLNNVHQVELKHRISQARKIGVCWSELVGKSIPMYQRFRLFTAVVTPKILCRSGTWVMTKAMEIEP